MLGRQAGAGFEHRDSSEKGSSYSTGTTVEKGGRVKPLSLVSTGLQAVAAGFSKGRCCLLLGAGCLHQLQLCRSDFGSRPLSVGSELPSLSQILARLLKSSHPEDLRAANKLIKEMVQEVRLGRRRAGSHGGSGSLSLGKGAGQLPKFCISSAKVALCDLCLL